MQAAEVISILRAHEAELKAAGITHLSLFGSTARGEQRPDSDVDVMVEFDQSAKISLMTVGRWVSDLEDLLGVPVDVSCKDWMRERVKRYALRDALDVF